MNRRKIIAFSSVIFAALPNNLCAQARVNLRKVGVLWGGVSPQTSLADTLTGILLSSMRERGWINGQNIHIEARWLPTIDRLKDATKELLQLGSEIIIVNSSPLLREVMAQTSSVPIVFVRVVDPVGQGFVRSLSSSGNNVTGFMHFYPDVAVKWLQILKELSPSIERVSVIFNPNTTPYRFFMQSLRGAVSSHGLNITEMTVQKASEVEGRVEGISNDTKCGVIVLPDISTINFRRELLSSFLKYPMPVIYPYSFFVEEGGLISYGIVYNDVYLDAAAYIDRILKGENPSSLPIQIAKNFEMVINLSTSQTLGLAVPVSLLARADKVIE